MFEGRGRWMEEEGKEIKQKRVLCVGERREILTNKVIKDGVFPTIKQNKIKKIILLTYTGNRRIVKSTGT